MHGHSEDSLEAIRSYINEVNRELVSLNEHHPVRDDDSERATPFAEQAELVILTIALIRHVLYLSNAASTRLLIDPLDHRTRKKRS